MERLISPTACISGAFVLPLRGSVVLVYVCMWVCVWGLMCYPEFMTIAQPTREAVFPGTLRVSLFYAAKLVID